jgi:hypothetical protein
MKYHTSTYGNSNPLTILCIPHTHGISNGLLSYIVSEVNCYGISTTSHGISNHLSMIYQHPTVQNIMGLNLQNMSIFNKWVQNTVDKN